MLAKNTRASVTTVAVALITGVIVALLVALMPTPAQAQSGDVLRLLSIHVRDITNDEGDGADEPYIEVDGNNVWDAGNTNDHLSSGTTRRIDVSVPISGANVSVQAWEADGGRQHLINPDDLIGQFSAVYTDGTEKTEPLGKPGEVAYDITYAVDRASPLTNNAPPEMLDLRPAPGSSTQNRTPLISATVRDNQTDLSESDIKFFVDGNAETFSYEKVSDKLTYQSAELAAGQHTVRIEATDAPPPQGLQTVKNWSFTVENTSTPPPGGGPGINNPPTIVPIAPAPSSSTQNRTPLISATVRDAETDLDGTAIKLFVDGIERTASYDKASDKLTYQSAKLAPGQHTVRIEATDASGLKGQNTWKFKVVRR